MVATDRVVPHAAVSAPWGEKVEFVQADLCLSQFGVCFVFVLLCVCVFCFVLFFVLVCCVCVFFFFVCLFCLLACFFGGPQLYPVFGLRGRLERDAVAARPPPAGEQAMGPSDQGRAGGD